MQPWYHGPIDREEATKRVVGKPAGTFLVRASVKETRAYALTVATGGKTYVHIKVLLGENGMCFVEGRQFLRLHDVVEYYQGHKCVSPRHGVATMAVLFARRIPATFPPSSRHCPATSVFPPSYPYPLCRR